MSALSNTPGDDQENGKPSVPFLPEILRNAITGRKEQSAADRERLFPVSAKLAAEAAAQEQKRKRAEAELLRNAVPGQFIPGRGVYFGVWTPKDREGRSLGKTFNVFATPHDLGLDENGNGRTVLSDQGKALEEIAAIRNLLGHAGGAYRNDFELYAALESGSYKGEWFMPPCELLNGEDVDDNDVQNENLYRACEQGVLKGTFSTFAAEEDNAERYWSCTPSRDVSWGIMVVDFSDGTGDRVNKFFNTDLSTRPVRAELRLES